MVVLNAGAVSEVLLSPVEKSKRGLALASIEQRKQMRSRSSHNTDSFGERCLPVESLTINLLGIAEISANGHFAIGIAALLVAALIAAKRW